MNVYLGGMSLQTKKKSKTPSKNGLFKEEKAVWGEGAYPLKKVKPLPKIEFLKKKSVWGEGASKLKKNPSENGLFEEKSCLDEGA